MRFNTGNVLQNKLSVTVILFFIATISASAQTNYIQTGLKDYDFLDRMEIKTGFQDEFYSNIKPFARRDVAQYAEFIDSAVTANPSYANLSEVDLNNLRSELMGNAEWTKPRDYYLSKKPVFNALYKTKSHLLEVQKPDLYLSVDPIVYFKAGKESDNDEFLYQNTRGVQARGMISRRVGFSISFTDNQELDPRYVQAWINRFDAVPGEGFYKRIKKNGGVDYFDARGSVSWNVAQHIDMQFGYDKNAIGTGYRSLFLSDFTSSATFFKINTHIWKFDYQNLYFELYPQYNISGNIKAPRKYARMNYLNINATKWLNVGVFESIVFGRENHFDFQYLLPVMFLRPAESTGGSQDNAMVGFDAKANIANRVQLYGQFLLDELKVKEMLKGTGWWGNKNGIQLGVKYVDAFGLKNVDLQFESNRVRPYTYSHFDSVANYSHYNQPLAHPLGANFQEFIGIVKAQPIEKLYLKGTAIYYYQGLDSFGINYGANLFESYNARPRDYDFKVGDGDKAKCAIVQLVASYELAQNMFVDFTALFRKYRVDSERFNSDTKAFSLSFRWNIGRRDFLF